MGGYVAVQVAEFQFFIEQTPVLSSKQDRHLLAGDSMTINMTTGNGTVDGRVRTVLEPGDN